jgi:Ca-activated chloride channel homolog
LTKRYIRYVLLLMIICQTLLPAAGNPEADTNNFENALTEGIELYNQGNLPEAEQRFKQSAASPLTETAAVGYYNQGTVLAQMAEQSQEVQEKRTLLEDAYESLKRAADLNSLSTKQTAHARQNMQIVREQLLQLPSEQDSKSQQDENGEKQDSQNGEESQQGESGQQGDQDQDQNSQSPQNPEDLLNQQQELSDKTQNSTESDQNLAQQQEELQQASEKMSQQDSQNSEALQEAAEQQKQAAEALQQGDREKAAAHQELAEEALAKAVEPETDREEGDQEMQEILNQEAAYEEQQKLLNSKGGISDAERNW